MNSGPEGTETGIVHEHHITVRRTGRYSTLGEQAAGGAPRAVWFVLHGYGQLAGRFLRPFARLADEDGATLVVAPEGLSRFYLDDVNVPAAERRVGASWMTREDRLAEIDDYVAYLDAVYAEVLRSPARPRVTVLGFSQGTATACRWLARGAARADRLIVWGGEVPPDLDLAAAGERLASHDLTLVAGRRDELITAKILARDTARLRSHGVAFRVVEFAGGHELDEEVLRQLW